MDVRKGRYRHVKGNEYEVVGTARHSETLEEFALYRPLAPSEFEFWVRPASKFFDTVERDGVAQPRFAYLGEA